AVLLAAAAAAAAACASPEAPLGVPVADAPFAGIGVRAVEGIPAERHIRNLRQLTFEGENAEAYWSFDQDRVVFQHRGEGVPADQIYTMRLDGTDLRLVSTGTGKTTCAYFLPGDREVIFASTHGASAEPPPPADMSRGYVWAIHDTYDLWAAGPGGLRRLTDSPGYDAEAVVSPDGSRIVFTSTRSGDLDLWTMNVDGTGLRQVTSEIGYDGGAFFTPDSKRLVYRAHHPEDPKEREAYLALLREGYIRPMALQIMTADLDGSNAVQVTRNGSANFGPYMHPDGRRILFSSNMGDPKGRDFDLWTVNADGSGLEQVTFSPEFDGFPMFSADGKRLIFCSNRHGAHRGNTNVFLADWVD
ncbi:MAG: PD40 domain-containing protein, partial [Planctomycetaceae bacterium]|nr:PD40 domain-containing protein [Planctomycetaceae bacterium]